MIQILYYDFPEQVAALDYDEVGRLVLAMVRYARGEEVELTGKESILWPMVKVTLDRQIEAEKAKAERNRENGAKGGRPKQTQEVPEETQENQENPENPTGFSETHCYNPKPLTRNPEPITNNPEHREKRTRFSPPTADEVRVYCQERRSKVDPQKFVDFYASKGWKIGNSPMKDWKAAVRTWEQRDTVQPRSPKQEYSAQNYTQRQYAGDMRNIFEDDEEVT